MVAGLAITALSQVSLVIGLGTSCSQPLLLNRPSSTDGSRRKASSNPLPDESGRRAAACATRLTFTDGLRAAGALWEMTPSCSHFSQDRSNCGVAAPCSFRVIVDVTG